MAQGACATPSSRRPRCACCARRRTRAAATTSRCARVGSGGEALGAETFEWGKAALGLAINEFYGQTECNLVLGSCAAIGVLRPGAIGKPVPGHTVAVIGADGRVLQPGELGQIAVKRPDPVMFLEYWGKPDATRDKFIGDWMTTGDQGVVDDEGYFSFVGRDDDVITSAGYRIGPSEIEDCLIRHPAVALAAVVGKPDADAHRDRQGVHRAQRPVTRRRTRSPPTSRRSSGRGSRRTNIRARSPSSTRCR